MKIKIGQEANWELCKKKNNTDPYSNRCVTYAEDWGALMEARMEKGEKIPDMAKETSREADTDGITGFMYGVAVYILASCWEHGEELRRWHNLSTQIGNEGDQANASGVTLNPALLSISTK